MDQTIEKPFWQEIMQTSRQELEHPPGLNQILDSYREEAAHFRVFF